MKQTSLMLLLSCIGLFNTQSSAHAADALVFSHVTVVDGTGAAAMPGMTVVIVGDRITALGKSGQVPIPEDSQVIEARGNFLIPGLWDMHVHVLQDDLIDTFLPLFIANGVTGVRDMYGDLNVLRRVQAEVAGGTRIAPRIVASGPIVDGARPIWPGSIAAANAAEGRQAVDEVKRRGADFVKVYNLLSADTYFAIASEASEQGVPFVGHVPYAVSAAQASDTGQKSIEHLSGIFLASSDEEEKLMEELAEVARRANSTWRDYLAVDLKSFESHRPEKAAALFARFVRNATWQTPTLTVIRGRAFREDSSLAGDPRLKYMAPSIIERWTPDTTPAASQQANQSPGNRQDRFRRSLRLVNSMREAGVGFLAGSDTPNPYCLPGFGLHDELRLLAQAGFTPLEALQAATRNPARFLGRLDSLGTVEKGKIADLVLLGANPLDDIGNTRKIESVVVGGVLISRVELDNMLAEVEAAVGAE